MLCYERPRSRRSPPQVHVHSFYRIRTLLSCLFAVSQKWIDTHPQESFAPSSSRTRSTTTGQFFLREEEERVNHQCVGMETAHLGAMVARPFRPSPCCRSTRRSPRVLEVQARSGEARQHQRGKTKKPTTRQTRHQEGPSGMHNSVTAMPKAVLALSALGVVVVFWGLKKVFLAEGGK